MGFSELIDEHLTDSRANKARFSFADLLRHLVYNRMAVTASEPIATVTLPAGNPTVLDDLFDNGAVQINGSVIKLGSRARADFAAKTVELGQYGPMSIPESDLACERSLDSYQRYEDQMESTFRNVAEERSADPETQSRIVRELWKLLYAWGRHS